MRRNPVPVRLIAVVAATALVLAGLSALPAAAAGGPNLAAGTTHRGEQLQPDLRRRQPQRRQPGHATGRAPTTRSRSGPRSTSAAAPPSTRSC